MKTGKSVFGKIRSKHVLNSVDDAVRMSEERYRRLFETAQDGILIIDGDTGLIDDVNPFLVDLLGYRREDFIGEPLWKFGPFGDILANRAAFQELLEKGYIRYKNLPLETRTGQRIEVEFVSNVYQVDRKRTVQCNIRDDSLSRQAEKDSTQLQAKLSWSEKMTASRSLAGGIAHQLNNALSVISMSLDLAEDSEKPMKTNPNIGLMKKAIEKMSHIIGELLSYARVGKCRCETVCITDIVRDCIPLFRSALKPQIALKSELPEHLPKIYVDKIQIRKALIAILQNSLEAIETEGRIQIICNEQVMPPEKVSAFAGLSPGLYVGLTVKDTGHGMDEEARRRVFEPFFTTHFPGRGLGMAAVYGIVKNHNGWISIESQPNCGTDVCIYLPAAASIVENPTFLQMSVQRTRQGLSC